MAHVIAAVRRAEEDSNASIKNIPWLRDRASGFWGPKKKHDDMAALTEIYEDFHSTYHIIL